MSKSYFLSVILFFSLPIFTLPDELPGECCIECNNGKTICVEPCTYCDVHEDYLNCDYEIYLCPFG